MGIVYPTIYNQSIHNSIEVLSKQESTSLYILGFQGASCSFLISIVNIFSLCIYIVEQNKQTKNLRIFKKIKSLNVQNIMKIQFCWRLIFDILINHKPSLGSRGGPDKIGTRSVQSF